VAQLIEKVIAGDNDAVLVFYNTYSSRILKYLLYHLPRKEDAEEVLNDVFFEAIDSLALFQKKSTLATWLLQIAKHKTADFYRKRKIKSILLSQAPFLEIVALEICEPEFQFEKDKIRNRLEAALVSLSEKYRKILTLHYEEQVPVKEIALEFHLSFKATESLLFRARKRFQKAYERT
jgi:RNA polymerase sigma-70 factor (ECF subfamily)